MLQYHSGKGRIVPSRKTGVVAPAPGVKVSCIEQCYSVAVGMPDALAGAALLILALSGNLVLGLFRAVTSPCQGDGLARARARVASG